MKNQYFLKDKKIKLVTKSSEQGTYGFDTTYQYITDSEIWAYTRQLSQDQIFVAKSYGEDESRLFVIGYRDDLDIYDFIEYKNKYYSITRIDTKDDYNTDLFIYTKDAAIGDTPSDIQPASD